ncbi:SDR family oxidoreductase [Bacillus andreraoultii]|uniref:SDR family oxidoreductase n=1 Tax=Bacillus andreraoultii TaxID=1499685 RepID=UPI000539FC5C|nr:SDR family oxidoreductase [Bacillus andreraoultii]
MENQSKKQLFPPQEQNSTPGIQKLMNPEPKSIVENDKACGKLDGKIAIITGGDSGIGRAVAIHFAKEGANVVISYLNEHEDANETKKQITELGGKCLLISGDIGDQSHCEEIVKQTIKTFGSLHILVNNAAEQHPQNNFLDISEEQLERTFRTNIFSYFYMTKASLPHLDKGGTVINTTSVTAYKGNPILIDYSATKGAIVSFTRSLSASLVKQGVRVNAVAPGPIWTPLIPSTFTSDQVATFGSTTPMKRAGEPYELAPAYVYLASDDSSYMTGQVLHINGGEIVNG